MTNRMIMGSTDREVDLTSSSKLIFSHADISFQSIATYLTALYGFIGLLDLYKPDEKGPRPWAEDDVALIDGAACDVRLSWSPHGTVVPMLFNGWPDKIEFTLYPASPLGRGLKLNLGVLEHFISGLGQALFTNFYENNKRKIEQVHGSVKQWPETWKFGRALRNAMAHNGRVDIRDNATVRWKGLSYSKADNGTELMNIDIWPADIFVLIKEMQAEISS
ncbi:hypothetical protein D7027_02065 [Ochrobactrum intermedium]|uniref:hypothetical protein n=1 Tax=Brucella intermedia TaxID=94625 RepID=UPI0012C3D80D|nr:hypothetical protein [Brucella intermedia]MPR60617.1 hypothetical protein [Brucella intermedia]